MGGIITANDLKAAFVNIGRPITDAEANNLVGEAPGPINFTQMVTLFAEKMAGGTDDDDVIIRSFEAFEINGQIDAEMFRHSLMTWGEKFSGSEIDDAFGEFKIDGNDRRSSPEKYNGGQERRRGITRLRFENLCCDSYQPTNKQTNKLTSSSVSATEQNEERKLSKQNRIDQEN